MRLEDINTLRELDRGEVVAKLTELGIDTSKIGEHIPTTDALRITIIEHTIERELGEQVEDTASKIGAEHFAEAVQAHAHGAEYFAEGRRLADQGRIPEADSCHVLARYHFGLARSAASVAQAGLTAGALGAIGSMLEEAGS